MHMVGSLERSRMSERGQPPREEGGKIDEAPLSAGKVAQWPTTQRERESCRELK